MRLIDIWPSLNSEVGFYNKKNFDKIPHHPGVYAWFYPLHIRTHDAEEFFEDICSVFRYDAEAEGDAISNVSTSLSWRRILLRVFLQDVTPNFNTFSKEWEFACSNEESFTSLRNTFYKASILMPPLYVGKTTNLFARCHQHLHDGNKPGCFAHRFTSHAKIKQFQAASRVSDLLLICIKSNTEQAQEGDYEGLIEMFLKNLAKPVYSKK